jgi:hypothetical protein
MDERFVACAKELRAFKVPYLFSNQGDLGRFAVRTDQARLVRTIASTTGLYVVEEVLLPDFRTGVYVRKQDA